MTENPYPDFMDVHGQWNDGWRETKRPFYGAECPSYPACNGGCGLGCTHEIENREPRTGAGSLDPSEYEWNCELIETELNHLMAYHAIKMGQIREKPHMVGWAVGQIMKSLKGKGSPKMVCDLVCERLWPAHQ